MDPMDDKMKELAEEAAFSNHIPLNALREFDEAIASYLDFTETPEADFDDAELAVYRSDVEDLAVVRKYVSEGNFQFAYDSAMTLDTAVRDEIPQSVWVFLTGES